MMKLDFDPFPILQSERLSLRQIKESDLEDVVVLRADYEESKNIKRSTDATKRYAINHLKQASKHLKKNKAINWAITVKPDDRLIGLIGFVKIQPQNFRAEIGYTLHPDYRNQGIMSEALQTVLAFGFSSFQLNSVIAVVDPSNKASERLLRKYLFQKDAHLRENIFSKGKFHDTAIYSLLQRDFS